MRLAVFGLLASIAAVVPVSAGATVINIDAGGAGGGWGCTSCFGGLPALDHVGNTVTLVNDGKAGPLQLTLNPGTYVVTNASTTVNNYSAWRFDGGATDWAWNYVIASDNGNNTANVIKAGGLGGVLPSQSDWQNATGLNSYYWDNGEHLVSTNIATTQYRDTFTLASATTLVFFMIDGYLPDNAGGIALNINAVATTPIPAGLPLFLTAIAGLGFLARRRRAATA